MWNVGLRLPGKCETNVPWEFDEILRHVQCKCGIPSGIGYSAKYPHFRMRKALI